MNRLQVSHRTERDRRGRGQQQEARLHSTGGNRTDTYFVNLLFLHQTNPSLKKINETQRYFLAILRKMSNMFKMFDGSSHGTYMRW